MRGECIEDEGPISVAMNAAVWSAMVFWSIGRRKSCTVDGW